MAKPKVLIVGDNEEARTMYREALTATDADLIEARAGHQAVTTAQEREFALVVIDIRLKGPDGVDCYEVAAMLRGDPRTASVPLLFVTTQDDTERVRKMAYRMGAAGVLLNVAVDPEILRLKTRALLQLHKAKIDAQQRAEMLETDLADAKRNIDAQKREIETVRRQATNDLLTGLPNRLLFEDRLTGALTRAKRSRQPVGLGYLDLDGFQPVNDRFGRSAGDQLLAEVSRRLVTVVRASDTVARLGADEFAVVLEGLDSSGSAQYVGEKVLKALSAPFSLKDPSTGEDCEVSISVSMGMALFPDHADSRNDLMMLADMAMYAVKRDGGGLRMATRPRAAANTKPSVVSPIDFRKRTIG